MFNKVAIIGVGLLGGSLGLELRRKKMAKTVVGCGRSVPNLKTAVRKKLIHSYVADVAKAVADADCIILAAPVLTIENHLKIIAKKAKPGSLVMDVGSTKEKIVAAASKVLPKHIFFVGAHPMAGTEKSGADAALPDLFKGRKCFLTPDKKTFKPALRLAGLFWKKIGCSVETLSPTEHDALLAATSHLPQVVAYALMSVLNATMPPKKLAHYAGKGLRDTTRIAASPASMWTDILLANQANMLPLFTQCKKDLEKIAGWVKKGNTRQLTAYFEKSSRARRQIV
ncbi:prephenate dehydrogenase [bacterium]|nr:prephenate dehydrogenase [bacterium]